MRIDQTGIAASETAGRLRCGDVAPILLNLRRRKTGVAEIFRQTTDCIAIRAAIRYEDVVDLRHSGSLKSAGGVLPQEELEQVQGASNIGKAAWTLKKAVKQCSSGFFNVQARETLFFPKKQ